MKIKTKKIKLTANPVPPPQTSVWNIDRDGVTQGLLSKFLMCPQLCKLGAKEGLSLNRSSRALNFGSLVHEILDRVYTYVSQRGSELTIEEVHECLATTITTLEKEERKSLSISMNSDPKVLEEFEELYAMAEGVLHGYLARWVEDFKGLTWIALEQTFETPISLRVPASTYREAFDKTITLRGKRDGVYRSAKSKSLWLFETKTKGRIDEIALMDRLPFDLQVMMYLWTMWKDYGEVPGGVLYNVIRTPQLKRKKGESLKQFMIRIKEDTQERPEFYYIRYQSAITKEDLLKWENEFRDQLAQLVMWDLGEFHYKNSSACSMGGVNCQFLPVCSRNDRSSFKVRDVAFPELTEKED